MSNNHTVAIVGTGYSKLERRSLRPLVLLARDAATRAIAEATLEVDQVDGLSTYPVLAPFTRPDIEIVTVPSMQEALHLDDRVKWYCEPHEGMIGSGVVAAYHALRSGACDYALVWRALHMPKAGRYNAPPPMEVPDAFQFSAPYGLTGWNGLFSALYTRYFELNGGSREKLATLAVTQRSWANKNPDAFFHDVPLSVDEYMSSRMLSDVMCLYDCDVPIDGACAIVMTTAERAKDLDVTPAYITDIIQGGPKEAQLWDLESAAGSMRHIANRLWASTGLGPDDIDAAMLYDGFSLFPILWLEGLGFCAPGEGLDFIQDGRIGVGGQIPLNTGGGSLSQGRLHGLSHMIEAARQVAGKAGERQVPNARHALATVSFNNGGTALAVSSSEP
ncbi:MAG: thiolase family protein [Acidimicrobiales bacterium]